MFRTSRTIASLIRTLMLGTTATVVTLGTTTVLVGCKDEGQPEYWVEKLADAKWRPRAVQRLEQFEEDAFTKANKNHEDPSLKALHDKILPGLVTTYVTDYDKLDTGTRVTLIKLIASTRDKRGEPALKKAFEEYAKTPSGKREDEDIKWACRAAGDLALPTLAGPWFQAFSKLKASSMLGGITYRDMNDAMLQAPAKEWGPSMLKLLDAPIERPDQKDPASVGRYRDQLFWQMVSAQVLGELGDPAAVKPLMLVLLDPMKADIQTTALLALVKLGKPSIEAATKLLKEEDKELIEFSLKKTQAASGAAEPPKDKPYISTAALIIGTTGRADGVAPMIAALETAGDDATKTIIARELAKLPATPESIAAFKKVFETIKPDTTIPPGMDALPQLAEAAGTFFDPSLVDWLLVQAENAKGDDDDKKSLQAVLLQTAMKLAKPDQIPALQEAVKKYGSSIEAEAFKLAEEVLKACGDRASCYVAQITKSQNQAQKTQFAGIKAGYMVAAFGDDKVAMELIKQLDAVTENAAVRFVASLAIDHLLPNGNDDAVKRINAMMAEHKKSADANLIQGDAPLRQVVYRLQSRSGK